MPDGTTSPGRECAGLGCEVGLDDVQGERCEADPKCTVQEWGRPGHARALDVLRALQQSTQDQQHSTPQYSGVKNPMAIQEPVRCGWLRVIITPTALNRVPATVANMLHT